jgi:hypothetical protein
VVNLFEHSSKNKYHEHNHTPLQNREELVIRCFKTKGSKMIITYSWGVVPKEASILHSSWFNTKQVRYINEDNINETVHCQD